VSTTQDATSLAMRSLTVAAARAITDYSDIVERGFLKEHPALVGYRLDLLAQMIAVVRRRVRAEEITWRREEVANGWQLPDPVADFAEDVAEFVSHTGCCPWCMICRGHGEDPADAAWQEPTGLGWPP
jgi:hypothetical protein